MEEDHGRQLATYSFMRGLKQHGQSTAMSSQSLRSSRYPSDGSSTSPVLSSTRLPPNARTQPPESLNADMKR
eukprot:1928640-Rhodomonas_salina.3